MHWFENYFAANSRAWLVSDPPDGKVPPQTDEARQRAAAARAARAGRGPGRFVGRPQPLRSLHHARRAGLDDAGDLRQLVPDRAEPRRRDDHLRDDPRHARDPARRHARTSSPTIRQYLGDARGHWEGNTLVVETTNFNDKVPYRGSSEHLKLIERFTPLGPDTLEWSVTFDDPHTWARPWTFAMNLTHDESQPLFEYACHEGNYGLAQHSVGRARRRGSGEKEVKRSYGRNQDNGGLK